MLSLRLYSPLQAGERGNSPAWLHDVESHGHSTMNLPPPAIFVIALCWYCISSCECPLPRGNISWSQMLRKAGIRCKATGRHHHLQTRAGPGVQRAVAQEAELLVVPAHSCFSEKSASMCGGRVRTTSVRWPWLRTRCGRAASCPRSAYSGTRSARQRSARSSYGRRTGCSASTTP